MYTILEYKKFIESNYDKNILEQHKDNDEFLKLLYIHSLKLKPVEIKDLDLPLLQKNTINEFYNLALQYRFKSINWDWFFSKCDKHSYDIYTYILNDRLKIKTPYTPYFFIRKFKTFKTNKNEYDEIIVEEHPFKGKKGVIVKWNNDIFVYGHSKYWFNKDIYNALIDLPFNTTMYGLFYFGKVSLYDIEDKSLTQIERFKKLAKIYYQNESKFKKVFLLPTHYKKLDFMLDNDKRYIIKTNSKSMTLKII